MSALPGDHVEGTEGVADATPGLEAAPDAVTVRRNAALSAVVGVAASALAIAYLWRAIQYAAPLDWVLCVVIGLVAAFHLFALLDARTPLVVADGLGVRIRLGAQWRGLPWDAVAQVEVQPRRGPFRDGRLAFHPHHVERALDGLDTPGRRTARLNEKLYGAPLVVPLGLTTRTSVTSDELPEALTRMGTTAPVVRVEPDHGTAEPAEAADTSAPTDRTDPAEPAEPAAFAEPATAQDPAEPAAVRAPRRSPLGGIGTLVSRFARGRGHDLDDPHPAEAVEVDEPVVPEPVSDTDGGPGPAAAPPPAPAAFAVPLRDAKRGLRAMVTRDAPATTLGAAALHREAVSADLTRDGLPERTVLRRPGSVELDLDQGPAVNLLDGPGRGASVHPIARLGDAVEPLVIDDFRTEPAPDPVIGPQLAAARTRVGLTVDELAERTRIRPHVIESIEVDDFVPCGGDFYARGHLRTLARVLGQDPGPLLEKFDNRYATAPINARKVFEAELATGNTGSMRSTVGGPNWALLVGCVLSLVMVWGVVRLFSTEAPDVDDALLPGATPVLNGSAGVDNGYDSMKDDKAASGPKPVPVTLVAAQAPTRVVVRDGDRTVVFAGPLVMGERKTLRVSPPVRVQARNAGAVEVRVQGKERGFVGELGRSGARTFHRAR
jgi:cytoskeletal protein RodZ